MLPAHLIQLIAKQQRLLTNRNVVCLSNQLLWRQPNSNHHQLITRSQSTQPAVREATTGWDKAKFPQQELNEIYWRAAKNSEDAALERRRQIGLLKVLIVIGAAVVGIIIGILFLFVLFCTDVNAPWHTLPIWTPWT